MLQAKGGHGFPYAVFLDESGTVLAVLRPNNRKQVAAAKLRAEALVKLRDEARSQKDDPNPRVRFLVAAIEVFRDPPLLKELETLLGDERLDASTRKLHEQYQVVHKIRAWESDYQHASRRVKDGEYSKFRLAWSDQAYGLYKGGLVPPRVDGQFLTYTLTAFLGAIRAKDLETVRTLRAYVSKLAETFPKLSSRVRRMDLQITGVEKRDGLR